MRGKPEAARAIVSAHKESRFISVVSCLEPALGIRDKAELKLLKKTLPTIGQTTLPLSKTSAYGPAS
jgi:hypothetical protein